VEIKRTDSLGTGREPLGIRGARFENYWSSYILSEDRKQWENCRQNGDHMHL